MLRCRPDYSLPKNAPVAGFRHQAAFVFEYGTGIFKHSGVLDKFIGDGVMALFGVLSKSDGEGGRQDALQAVRAACEFRRSFDSILSRWLDEWKLYTPQKIDIGLACGIHTGEALVGNVGTDFRDQFTALGPHVNFASRIEARAKAGQILVSQSTEARIKEKAKLEPGGEINDIKNIPGTFNLCSILDTNTVGAMTFMRPLGARSSRLETAALAKRPAVAFPRVPTGSRCRSSH